MTFTTKHIHQLGRKTIETSHYTYYTLDEIPDRYDNNLLELHHMPTSEQWQQYEAFLIEEGKKHQQTHAQFIFPANAAIPLQLRETLTTNGYELKTLGLYETTAARFQATREPQPIDIFIAQGEWLERYLIEQFYEDYQWGEGYAQRKMTYFRKLLTDDVMQAVIAIKDGDIAGGALVFQEPTYVELDSLYVLEDYQMQGIATAIQQFVMTLAGERTVLLIADEDDTPKAMYERQGYTKIAFHQAALKTDIK